MQSHVQYQHYIPRFILRNFSHPYKPPKSKRSQKNGGPPRRKDMRKGNEALNIVDLASDEPQLREAPVSRWFGQENMYDSASNNAIKSQKRIEEELQRLESRAAAIFLKLRKAHENEEPGIFLDRTERDRLRKFLFIMKCRGPSFFDKYIPEKRHSYQWEDKDALRLYMADKGFENSRDVWLHNLRAILDLEMDAECEWVNKLPKVMFPPDAEMFIYHVSSSYTAFCTPSESDDEFILTDQCYNLFEGPNHETTSATTGENMGSWHLCFHEFFPISARLIIVLRSFVLPNPQEDANPEIRDYRRMCLEGAVAQFPHPKNVKSILADLPVAKATNSYSRIVNGRLELDQGAAHRARGRDKFCFRFWPIERKHVDIINSIFLDNVLTCKSIVFRSALAFTRTLEVYLTMESHGFKQVGVGERHAVLSRREGLDKLSVVLKALGSNKTPLWKEDEEKPKWSRTQCLDDVWLDIIKVVHRSNVEFTLRSEARSFFVTYYTLGGTKDTFLTDLEQSWRLYQFHAFIYNLSRSLSDHTGRKARANVLDLIPQFHPRRIWLYVKHQRWVFSDEYARLQQTYVGTAPIFLAKTKALMAPEREDEIVKANQELSHERLSQLMFATGGSEILSKAFSRGG